MVLVPAAAWAQVVEVVGPQALAVEVADVSWVQVLAQEHGSPEERVAVLVQVLVLVLVRTRF